VTARTFVDSQTVSWDDVAGLRFGKSAWAYAQLKDGTELRLPAVTFATLPLLTEASAGRVPNPYK
jgi:PH (Pleckstrin Homology) domain-containing protein